jgi:hypothetical protein
VTTVQLVAIPDVEAGRGVVHLAWSGPTAWLYAPGGWQIQRRRGGRIVWRCEMLTGAVLAALRETHLIRFPLGLARHSTGTVPQPLAGPPTAEACEVFAFELDAPTDHVRIDLDGKKSWAFGFRGGKAVAVSPPVAGGGRHTLVAPGIDRILLYAQVATTIGVCVGSAAGAGDWQDVAKLQIPLREVDPSLTSVAAERALARSRLAPGDAITDDELDHLAAIVRPVLQLGTRPSAACSWISGGDADPAELAAIEPLRVALIHPRWRRVLGFAWTDRDPALVVGAVFEYRVIGAFPAADLSDVIAGFHTVPATTAIPARFALGDVAIALPQPTTVTTIDPPAAGPGDHVVVTRRMIALSPEQDGWWGLPSLDDSSAIVDLPVPVTAVTLELGHAAHSLQWIAVDADDHESPVAVVPATTAAVLTRPTPFVQIRLRGKGALCAIRIHAGTPPIGMADALAATPPLVIGPTPPPAPPAWITAGPLQEPLAIATPGTAPVAARHHLGFAVRWRPATVAVAWPSDKPGPPIDAAAFELEHRPAPAGAWSRVVDEDYVFGDRGAIAAPPLVPGADLMAVFPEQVEPAPAAGAMRFLDAFDADLGAAPRRPTPPPGTMHQYRIRAVDVVGRASATWTESAAVQLQKHDPPPAPVGVETRVLVEGDPDLTAAEHAILGGHANAIVVRWGWYAEQRRRDPSTREFRIYVRRDAFDSITGTLAGATVLSPGRYQVTLVLAGAVATDAAVGLRIEANYPFRIESHTGGAAGAPLTAVLRALVPALDGTYPEPAAGAIRLPLHLDPHRTRPAAWGPRVAIRAITAAETYDVVLFDLLSLTEHQPADRVTVGVSAADAEPYVADPLAPADSRAGNEGVVVAAVARGRWHGRPTLVDAPALAEVPAVRAPEPRGRPIAATLDLTPLLAGTGLGAGEPLAYERAAVDEIARHYHAAGDAVLADPPAPVRTGEVATPIAIANADDRAAVIAALGGTVRLADRYAVYLGARHPQRDRLFTSIGPAVMPATAIVDALPPRGGRWLYRARRVDAAGRRSATAVVLRGVVRVPGAPPSPPIRDGAIAGDPARRFRIRVEDRDDLGALIVFTVAADLRERADGAALLRVPGTLGAGALRLRLADGAIVAPEVIATVGPAVTIDAGFRHIVVDVPAPGPVLRVWAACTTEDGLASAVTGPWRVIGATP